MRYRFVIAVMAVLATACSTSPELTGSWLLDELRVEGELVEIQPSIRAYEYDVPAWVRFESDGTLRGELPCNSIAGDYSLIDGRSIRWLVVQDAGLCLEPEGVMEVEEPMTDLIWTEEVDVALDGGRLTISGSGVTMTFVSLDAG